MHRLAALSLIVLLAACKSEGRQAWERYEFLKDNGASADELCDAASEAAEAYSWEQKQTDYLVARSRAALECLRASDR